MMLLPDVVFTVPTALAAPGTGVCSEGEEAPSPRARKMRVVEMRKCIGFNKVSLRPRMAPARGSTGLRSFVGSSLRRIGSGKMLQMRSLQAVKDSAQRG